MIEPPRGRSPASRVQTLAKRLYTLGLESVAVRDDGNCQFRAFSQQLSGTQDFHRAIRAALVEHMAKESRFFGAMFDEGELATYLTTMGRARTWGDELTLRAFADCYEVCVHVVASTEGNWHLIYSPQDNDVHPKKHVFLTYLSPVPEGAVIGHDQQLF